MLLNFAIFMSYMTCLSTKVAIRPDAIALGDLAIEHRPLSPRPQHMLRDNDFGFVIFRLARLHDIVHPFPNSTFIFSFKQMCIAQFNLIHFIEKLSEQFQKLFLVLRRRKAKFGAPLRYFGLHNDPYSLMDFIIQLQNGEDFSPLAF